MDFLLSKSMLGAPSIRVDGLWGNVYFLGLIDVHNIKYLV